MPEFNRRKRAPRRPSVPECNTQQKKVSRNSRAGIYHSKSLNAFRLKEQVYFSCLLFHKHSRVGWRGVSTAPMGTCVLPELLLSNSITDKLERILFTTFRSMASYESGCHVRCSQMSPGCREEKPPNPGLMAARRVHMKEISPWPLYSPASSLSRHRRCVLGGLAFAVNT